MLHSGSCLSTVDYL